MTKKGFREAMMRGLGRCVLELDQTEDVEKYREIVLWGCTHDLSYHSQFEGPRAWYLRELIRRFHDEKPFVDIVIRKLSQYRSKFEWGFSHYCRLLGLFAQEGNEQALAALWRKYEELYEILKSKRKGKKNGTFAECDDFEELCIELINSAMNPLVTYIKIAEDVGTLMLENSVLEPCSFDWIFNYCEQTYGKSRVRKMLAKKAESSPAVNRYFNDELAWNSERSKKKRRQPVPQTTEEMLNLFYEECKREQDPGSSGWKFRRLGFKVRAWVRRTGNTEILPVLAQKYLAEQNPLERARLLFIFGSGCPFPLSPEPLIQDARTGDDILREAAFFALDYVHHEKVRLFALELAERGECATEAASLLVKHYQKEDREVLVRLVKSIPVSYDDKEDWHDAYASVLNLLEAKGVKDVPKELLPYLYEHALCSFCREHSVKEMGRRHMMTEELLQECLYDSNDKIRNYAQKRLKSCARISGRKEVNGN